MAARTVLKLFANTCSYKPSVASYLSDRRYHKRSSSLTATNTDKSLQIRKICKSYENLRDYKYLENDFEIQEINPIKDVSTPLDTSYRMAARSFPKEREERKVVEGPTNIVYHLGEVEKTDEIYYDVMGYIRKNEESKMKHLFYDLQPCALKPYGTLSSQNFHQVTQRKFKISYPSARGNVASSAPARKKNVSDNSVKEYSSYKRVKQYPANEEIKKVALCETRPSLSRMQYSTVSSKKKHTSRTKLTSVSTRKSSTLLLRQRSKKELIKRRRPKNSEVFIFDLIRDYNTKKSDAKGEEEEEKINCDDYVTVKLRDLQDECIKEARCKPRKFSFGKLPKLQPPDCPCIEDYPLKEGKPLLRLKKRFDVKPRKEVCVDRLHCTTPRADAGYKVKPKVLPKIKMHDCPCEEVEMTDWSIKRLPKKHIPEPPKVCPCPKEDICCNVVIEKPVVVKKKLPKLIPSKCPCIENITWTDLKIKRLPKVEVPEPKKICINPAACTTPRADDGMQIKTKTFRALKGECECVEPPPMKEAPSLKRLPKVNIPDKKCPEPKPPCWDAERADDKMAVAKKKLPKFVPQDCPCIEIEPPTLSVKMKRLPQKIIPEPPKVCPDLLHCPPRADDGMIVKTKVLPILEPKDCPCEEREMIEAPPLKRLVPKPIEEPKKICIVEVCDESLRADANYKVKQKKLPILKPGRCECIEIPPPLDVPPLKKLKAKPIEYTRVCVDEKLCHIPRADDNLKIKLKTLPILVTPDCPCIEPSPPEDVPLKRLKRVNVPEPKRVCPKIDDCDEKDRADVGDWLYWRKNPKCKSHKKSVNSSQQRCYSTATSLREYSPSNVIINIQPSAPLVLAQRSLDNFNVNKSKNDGVTIVICKGGFGVKTVKETSSEIKLHTPKRSLSTCTSLMDASECKDCKKPHQERHLQPKNPIIPEKETFITLYPSETTIESSLSKSRIYDVTRKEDDVLLASTKDMCPGEVKNEKYVCESKEVECTEVKECKEEQKQLTVWEKLVNYFKARPNCPPPEEFKRMKLKEEAEAAAAKAGLCLYDPKEMLEKHRNQLPKVVTADSRECE